MIFDLTVVGEIVGITCWVIRGALELLKCAEESQWFAFLACSVSLLGPLYLFLILEVYSVFF